MNKKLFLTMVIPLLSMSSLSISKPYVAENSPSELGIFKDNSIDEIKDYYKNIKNGSNGEELLQSLQITLTNGQKNISSSLGGKSWDLYVLLDRDFVKDPLSESEISAQKWKVDNVICKPLYDDEFIFRKTESPGNKVNREHVLPKSYGFGNASGSSFLAVAATDMHNLHMGEANNNQQGHNNYPFGEIDETKDKIAITSSISGKVTGFLGKNNHNIPVYEPLDSDKGDIARSIFYMAARYHNYDPEIDNSPSIKLSDKPTDIYSEGSKKTITAIETKDNPCEYGILSDLLLWNESDKVDDHEIHRNNLVFNAVQSNRNPFIDYPSWANIAFGNDSKGVDIEKNKPSQIGENNTNDSDDSNEPQDNNGLLNIFKEWAVPIIGSLITILIILFIITRVGKRNRRRKH